jgi:magnesium-transporting ATPase (P-type)
MIADAAAKSVWTALMQPERSTPNLYASPSLPYGVYMTRTNAPTNSGEQKWHAMKSAAVLDALQSSVSGLNETEVRSRRERYGPNVLPARKPPTIWAIVLHQFMSPLIYILLVAAAVAVALEDYVDTWFIMAVVLLNAALGASQEWKAEQSATALQQMLKIQTRVRRSGAETKIAAEDLVPGDIVLLESGNSVPADLRLLRANNLRIDEAFLTGESLPAEKRTDPVGQDAPVGDRTGLAFAGSTVMAGRGEGVVVATGLQTEVGAIAETVTAAGSMKPPLVLRMEKFANQISFVILACCVLLAVVALRQGMGYAEVFFLAVAFAVAAIPEGLPVAMTVALSIATTRMARRNVVVRRLTAVEGLGSCTFIASDKTGTLTVNRQTVRRIILPTGETFEVTGDGYAGEGDIRLENGEAPRESAAGRLREIAAAGVIANEAALQRNGKDWTFQGDAVDVALLALGYKAGQSPDEIRGDVNVVSEVPFESERAYSATFYERQGVVWVAVKGALEVVLPRCENVRAQEGTAELNPEVIEAQAKQLSESGHRFLALATGELPNAPDEPGENDLPPLTLLGLVGLIDPPREEAKPAVAQCRHAGIEVAMVTGDHPVTAFTIARALGIAKDRDEVVNGMELTALGDPKSAAFDEATKRARVFARVSPFQKLQIVESLQRQGHFVAVTGDGVNDAPALKAANISVAMGSGSDVTKDTASLIVTDDNFASIEAGVEEGRFAYDNIRKVTYLLIATAAGLTVLVTLALFAELPIPLLPVQLLWLNLVTNGIQDIALAFEGGEPGAMDRPPRNPTESVFDRLMIWQTLVAGLTMGLLAFVNWRLLLGMDFTEEEARNRLLLLMVLFQNFHVFNSRSERESAFRVPISRNYFLVGGVALALAVHVASMHIPFMQRLLRIAPVGMQEWLVPIALASAVLGSVEIFKIFLRRGWLPGLR